MAGLKEYYPQFFTATILEWKPLLKEDRYNDIIVSSLQFLVQNKRAVVYGFVIMPNHIHLIWQIAQGHKRENVQRDFLKYIAQQIKTKHRSKFVEHTSGNSSGKKLEFSKTRRNYEIVRKAIKMKMRTAFEDRKSTVIGEYNTLIR